MVVDDDGWERRMTKREREKKSDSQSWRWLSADNGVASGERRPQVRKKKWDGEERKEKDG